MPGESFIISKGKITIFNSSYPDGLLLEEPYLKPGELTIASYPEHKCSFFFEGQLVTVSENTLFVLGDNRQFSYDSRCFGFLPLKLIKGKVLLSYYSPVRGVGIEYLAGEVNY